MLRTVVARTAVLRPLARWRMRRRVRWLSLTFVDFDLGGFSGCGLTCAAHTPGTNKTDPTIISRRRQRVPSIRLPGFPICFRCTKPASSQPWPITSPILAILRELHRFRQQQSCCPEKLFFRSNPLWNKHLSGSYIRTSDHSNAYPLLKGYGSGPQSLSSRNIDASQKLALFTLESFTSALARLT